MHYLLKILGKAVQLRKEGFPLSIHMRSICARRRGLLCVVGGGGGGL